MRLRYLFCWCCLKDDFFRMSQTNSQNVVEWTSFFHARLLTISGYRKSYQLYKCNHSDILTSTTISSKVNTFIAIISIYIPVELAFDATLIESKGLFSEIKKWENCNFSWITLSRLIFSKNLQVNYKNLEIMNFDFRFLIILL